ncbi:MAG: CopD family protein [Gammaproteobacteria bacterium]|nr:CopD family protein [Gammaproteobacteria bacterium]
MRPTIRLLDTFSGRGRLSLVATTAMAALPLIFLLVTTGNAMDGLAGAGTGGEMLATPPPVDRLALGRAAYLAFLLVSAGTAWFIVLIPVPSPLEVALRRLLASASLVGIITGSLYLWLTAGYDGPVLVSPAALGPTLGVAAVGFACLLTAASRAGRSWLLGGAVLLAGSRVLTGHPVSREPSILLMPLMFLHASCAAYWIGSLWPLYRLLGRESPQVAATVVERFSTIALAAVATLVVAGVTTTFVHLRTPSALMATWYGQLLLMKATWFTVLMSIAAYHKLRLTPRLAAGDGAAARRMRWGIGAEAAVMFLVILISTLVAATAPEALPPASGR